MMLSCKSKKAKAESMLNDDIKSCTSRMNIIGDDTVFWCTRIKGHEGLCHAHDENNKCKAQWQVNEDDA